MTYLPFNRNALGVGASKPKCTGVLGPFSLNAQDMVAF
jgi:hypothetical protein